MYGTIYSIRRDTQTQHHQYYIVLVSYTANTYLYTRSEHVQYNNSICLCDSSYYA